MQLKLQERLQSLKMVASLATFLKNPGSLDSVFAVANSVKDTPRSRCSGTCSDTPSSVRW